jgi:hypothetical protein
VLKRPILHLVSQQSITDKECKQLWCHPLDGINTESFNITQLPTLIIPSAMADNRCLDVVVGQYCTDVSGRTTMRLTHFCTVHTMLDLMPLCLQRLPLSKLILIFLINNVSLSRTVANVLSVGTMLIVEFILLLLHCSASCVFLFPSPPPSSSILTPSSVATVSLFLSLTVATFYGIVRTHLADCRVSFSSCLFFIAHAACLFSSPLLLLLLLLHCQCRHLFLLSVTTISLFLSLSYCRYCIVHTHLAECRVSSSSCLFYIANTARLFSSLLFSFPSPSSSLSISTPCSSVCRNHLSLSLSLAVAAVFSVQTLLTETFYRAGEREKKEIRMTET